MYQGTSRLSEDMIIQLYNVYVRTVWVNAADYHINRLAAMKTRMLRIILGYRVEEINNKGLYLRANMEPV